MLAGTSLSTAFFKSSSTPLSYSIVVTAPVDPEQKTVTIPFLILDFSTKAVTGGVISTISQNPLVGTEIVSDLTMRSLP
jgi:hypothetical protein